jgi:hypothetical protein
MILPPQPFGYENVCQLVGPYRPIQVTDVATQRTVDCTLKEFVNYLLHYDETTTATTREKEIKQGISGSKQQKCSLRSRSACSESPLRHRVVTFDRFLFHAH